MGPDVRRIDLLHAGNDQDKRSRKRAGVLLRDIRTYMHNARGWLSPQQYNNLYFRCLHYSCHYGLDERRNITLAAITFRYYRSLILK